MDKQVKNSDARSVQNSDLSNEIDIWKAYQYLAMKILYPDQYSNLKKTNSILPDILVRGGIVESKAGSPSFIHHTFAEYFAINFIMDELRNGNTYQSIQDIFLKETLLTENYQVARALVNGFLKKNPILGANALKKIGKRIIQLLNDGIFVDAAGNTILHMAAEEGNSHIIELLSACLKKSVKITTEFLLSKNKNGQIGWHVAAKNGHSDVLDELRKWAPDSKFKMDMLMATTVDGDTAWKLAIIFDHPIVLSKLWSFCEEELSMNDDELKTEILMLNSKTKENLFFSAARLGRLEILKQICQWAETLGVDCVKELFVSKDDELRSVWYIAAVGEFLELIDPNNKYKGSPKTSIASRIEVLDYLWKFGTANGLGYTDSKALLLSKGINGETIFNHAAKLNYEGFLKKSSVWAEEINLDMEDLLSDIDNNNLSVRDLVASPNHYGNRFFLEFLDYLSLKDIEEILLKQGNSKETVWHKIVKNGDLKILEKLRELYENETDPENEEHPLLASDLVDFKKQTTWHMIARNSDTELFQFMLKWGNEEKIDFEKYWFTIKDIDGHTACDYLLVNNITSKGELFNMLQE